MAYAEVAGVSPVNGLYALLLPAVAYVLLGSSRQLIVGPEGSVSTLVGAAVLPLAASASDNAAELAAMLALLVAACFALAWVLRLGWIADYFSRPVLVGYIHGVAVVLIIGQLGKLARSLDRCPRPAAAALGGSARARTASAGRRSCSPRQRSRRCSRSAASCRGCRPRSWSSSAAIGLSWAFDLQAHGVAVVGAIPAGLPSFAVPRPAWQDVIQLLPAAVGIFLVSFADEILTARSFAGKHNQHVRASQELLAMGAANAAAGFTQGFSIGASGSRTAVNDSMGARSQVAGLVAAAAVLAIVVFLTEPVQYLPKAVLGAVIVFAAIGLFEPHGLACSGGGRPCRGRDRRRDDRLRHRVRRARGAHRRRRAVDDRHRAQKRKPARRGARLGRAARALRGRLAAPDARA